MWSWYLDHVVDTGRSPILWMLVGFLSTALVFLMLVLITTGQPPAEPSPRPTEASASDYYDDELVDMVEDFVAGRRTLDG